MRRERSDGEQAFIIVVTAVSLIVWAAVFLGVTGMVTLVK
jgi:hypothetical protein